MRHVSQSRPYISVDWTLNSKSGKDAMISKIRNSISLTSCWFATAVGVGTMMGQMFACWLNMCGTSWISVAALVTGVATGGVMLLQSVGHLTPSHSRDWMRSGLFRFSSAITLVLLSWLMPTLLNATLLAGCETIGSTWPGAVLLTLIFPALMALVITVAAGLFFQTVDVGTGRLHGSVPCSLVLPD